MTSRTGRSRDKGVGLAGDDCGAAAALKRINPNNSPTSLTSILQEGFHLLPVVLFPALLDRLILVVGMLDWMKVIRVPLLILAKAKVAFE